MKFKIVNENKAQYFLVVYISNTVTNFSKNFTSDKKAILNKMGIDICKNYSKYKYNDYATQISLKKSTDRVILSYL